MQLKHTSKRGRVTVAHHAGLVVKPKTLARVLEQAEPTIEELRRLL
ncbi:MAG: type II toxin-antitoxin system HicA family toxin [Chloroflexi bacterium]|nr:type II toxin-antitoxin system HicA family toxin [Chloroflexota bacterium]